MGRLPGSQYLHLAIGLPLRNEQSLDALLAQIYDPASTNYHHYLTPEQFTEQFGPAEKDYAAVISFARTNGLTVTATYPNRTLVDASGSVADIERVFHVTMRVYRHPEEARMFYAPDVEPVLDLAVPVLHISGLDNYSLPHPMNLKMEPANQPFNATSQSGSGPGGTYAGYDFRAAYVPGVSLDGSGQMAGLVEFDGYYANDIATYENAGGLPHVPLTNVLVDGATGSAGGNNDEVALDIEMAIAIAPGLSGVIVYEESNGNPWVDILAHIANDNLAKQISCSWGGGSPDSASEQIFKQMAVQGQSFFNASGDSDAFTGSVPFPSDSTNITQVGGTSLTTTGPGGAWVSETVWNWGLQKHKYVGSSGGISTYYSIPIWQQGINMTTNRGSTTMRNIPDVALTADNIWVAYNNGSSGGFGGTSCAAPLWAGFAALVNQQAAAAAKPPVGFINPAVYAIGKGPNYNTDFHDVITGNNTNKNSGNKFFAGPGYDLCTGWGTPNGVDLINALAPPPALLPLAFQMVTQTNDAIMFAWNTVTGLVYQVQYKTNLLQTNWIDLGGPIIATNTATTTSDIIGTEPQRFYRIGLTQ
ncbi:MAG: S53 family peptidase [Verrucomicrobiia bacterium]